MIMFEILFPVFIVGVEYVMYYYISKEYDNINKNIKKS